MLNKEEMLIGFIFVISFFPIIGLWAIFLALASSYLWALTGMGASKLFRRLLIPALACFLVYASERNWHIIFSLPMAFGVLSLGYGIPSFLDDGSALGRFWFKFSQKYANILTRATIYLLLMFSFGIGIYWK